MAIRRDAPERLTGRTGEQGHPSEVEWAMTASEHLTRLVMPHELIFALTDRRGIITGVNTTFARTSKFTPEQLIGSPHNMVRNPYMPGGVFRLMWEMITAGRPFAGYVQSMASDGAGYWLFVTITPVSGGFLAVHAAPCIEAAWQQIAEIYEGVLREEVRAQVEGMERRETAKLGRDYFLACLADIGFAGYADFMLHILPAEIIERSKQAEAGRPLWMGRAGARIDVLRRSATDMGHEMATLLDELTRYRAMTDELRRSGVDTVSVLQGLGAVVGAARDAMDPQTSGQVAEVIQELIADGARSAHAAHVLVGNVEADLVQLTSTQVRVALAKLHADVIDCFAQDMVNGGAAEMGIAYIPDIHPVLGETVRQLAVTLRRHGDCMAEAVSITEGLARILARFQMMLFTWRNVAMNNGAARVDQLGPVDAQLNASFAQVIALRDKARQCQGLVRGFDPGPMLHQIQQIAAAADLQTVDPQPVSLTSA